MLWRHAANGAAALTVGVILLLTGCSSIASPVAAPTSTTSTAAPTSQISGPAASGPAASGTVSAVLPSDDSAAVASQSAARESRRAEIAAATPADFDEQTAAWFDAMCQPFADLNPRAYDKDGNDSLSPLESLDYYRAMSETFDATSKAAASLPPPTTPDGADLVSRLTASLSDAGTGLGALVDKSSGSATGPTQQIADILREASQSFILSGFSPMSSSDPSIIAALHPLPSCAAVGW